MIEKYSYGESNLSIKDDFQAYRETVSEILENLEAYASDSSPVSVDEVLGDDQLDVPGEYFEGDYLLEPHMKYDAADGAAVYVFESPEGLELVGNKAMIDMSLPDKMPSII